MPNIYTTDECRGNRELELLALLMEEMGERVERLRYCFPGDNTSWYRLRVNGSYLI